MHNKVIKMKYTTEERIAFLEEKVSIQSEQINRLQQCLNEVVKYSDLSRDTQIEIVNVLCGDDSEFIVNTNSLFPTEEEYCEREKENSAFNKFSEDDQDVLKLFLSSMDKDEQQEKQDNLPGDDTKKTISYVDGVGDFYDPDGTVRRNYHAIASESRAKIEDCGDFELTFAELDEKYGKLSCDDSTGEFYDARGFVRRIANIEVNKKLAYQMANNKLRVGDNGGKYWKIEDCVDCDLAPPLDSTL